MAKKVYTLTRKSSVIGPVGNEYKYNRYDVITQEQYDKLVKRHKDQFEEGRKEPTQATPASKSAEKQVEGLEARVEALESVVKAAGIEDEVEELNSADAKESDKSSDESGSDKDSEKTSKKSSSSKSKKTK